jgi:hypothetical protein
MAESHLPTPSKKEVLPPKPSLSSFVRVRVLMIDVFGVGIYHPHVNPTGAIFYTKNGRRIPEDAFRGAFFPRNRYDVFAMIGLSGEAKVTVNFGQEKFKWHEGNETGWKLGQENFEKPRLE